MTIKARFDGQVFIPEGSVNLPVGSLVEIPVEAEEDASVHQTILRKLMEIASEYPDDPEMPTDGAEQHDHYLYGTPKRP